MYHTAMAKLTEDDVLHVAKLAKLTLSDEELQKFQKQLSAIVEYINQLEEIDTSKVEPTSQTTGLENVTREDEVKPDNTLSQEEALSGTDRTFNGYFVVDAILEKDKSDE